ncbi:hypothetical protein ACKS0A_01806 [Histoplasma ohiense]
MCLISSCIWELVLLHLLRLGLLLLSLLLGLLLLLRLRLRLLLHKYIWVLLRLGMLNTLLCVQIGLELKLCHLLRRELLSAGLGLQISLHNELLPLLQDSLLLLLRGHHHTIHLGIGHYGMVHNRGLSHGRSAGTCMCHSLRGSRVAHYWCAMWYSRGPLPHLWSTMSALTLLASCINHRMCHNSWMAMLYT